MRKNRSKNNIITIITQPLLVDAVGAAKLLSISPEYLWQLDRDGKIPLPIKLGRRKLWSVEELKQWVDDGCLRRDKNEKAVS